MSKQTTVAQLAKELGITPKRLRSILRKKGMKPNGTRWVFSSSDKAKIKALLKGKSAKRVTRRHHAEEQRASMH